MNPTIFEQANIIYGPPDDMTESQVAKVHAYEGVVKGGSVDGAKLVIVAWKPSPEELKELNEGGSIFLSSLGGLNPHRLTTNFQAALQ